MTYLILGLVALVVVILAMHGFTRANTTALARNLRMAGGIILLSAAVALTLRGMVSHALPLAVIGWWLIAGQRGMPWSSGGGTSQQSPGQSSRVVTDYLEMELDHDTGAMRGRVLKGAFAGREIESLAPIEMALLWRDCQFADPPSAQVIEVYLDRVHPTWREDLAREEGAHGAGGETRQPGPSSGVMRVEEALEILGLEPGASEDDIRRAHRELMLKLHPDRGGSTYLAAKINEAKDVLLSRKRE